MTTSVRVAFAAIDAGKTVDRGFLMAIVRRALACSPHGLSIEARVKELVRVEVSRRGYQNQLLQREVRDLKRQLDALAPASADPKLG